VESRLYYWIQSMAYVIRTQSRIVLGADSDFVLQACVVVLIELQSVTDTQTHTRRHTDGYPSDS